MTNKPMLSVERDLIERAVQAIINTSQMQPALNELRAILDKPINVRSYGAVGDGIADDSCAFQAALCAQHQGEPVAWLIQCQHSGLVEQSEPNNKSNHPDDWSDAFPVFREQPAPVAVTITDEQILEAMRHSINSADGGYVVDTAPENVIAAGRALLESARLNGLKT